MKKFLTLAFALVFSTGIAYGQNNESEVTQDGDFSTATVDQAGSMLDATVYQGGSSSQQRGNDAIVNQTGASNEAYVQQLGEQNDADIEQAGSGNYAEIVGQTGFSNDASALQDADTENSSIYIDQQGDGNNTFDSESAASAIQYGEVGSTIDIFEHRAGTYSTTDVVQQYGESNTATVDVFGGNDAVDILQDNVTNSVVEVYQTATGQNTMGGHYGKVTQMNGDTNEAFLTQTGLDHSSTIMQNGSTNTATVTQSGN